MIIRVLGFLIALCVSGGAFAQSVPLAFDMLKPAENGEVVMSADGTRVALVAAATDRYCFKQSGAMRELGDLDCAVSRQRYRTKHTIFIYDLETSQTLKSMPLPEDYLVSWIDWVNNDRLLAAIHKPQLGKRYGGMRIASIPVDTQDYTFLFQDREDVLRANKYMARITDFLPDDPNHVLLPAKDTGELDLWKVNVVSGTSVKVASGKKGTFRWFTNAKG